MTSIERFMRHAKRFALQSQEQFMLGACLVKSGRILGVGKNSINRSNHLTHKYFDKYPTIHAEMNCLVRLDPEDIRGSVVYVWRQKRTGEPGMAKPCKRCAIALRDMGVKRVVYTTDDGFDIWEPAA